MSMTQTQDETRKFLENFRDDFYTLRKNTSGCGWTLVNKTGYVYLFFNSEHVASYLKNTVTNK